MAGPKTIQQEIISYCAAKENALPDFPFGDDVMVFKVKNKMFALIGLKERDGINLKCDPVYAQALRKKYDAVVPGYHMNKQHWNTIYFDGTIPKERIFEWIDDSYDLVLKRKK